MGITEKVYDLYERFGVEGGMMEAGKALENAVTQDEDRYWSDVLDGLMDMEED